MDIHNSRGRRGSRSKRSWFHRVLLSLPAESAHTIAISALRFAQATPILGRLEHRYQSEVEVSLKQELLGHTFCNPVGLAAGFDKDGLVIPGMAALGFGWLEVGAVTPRPQPGNPRPRLFRHAAAASLENAMGFNNRGGPSLARRLARWHPAPVPLFVNLGKNHWTPNERAADDYLFLVNALQGNCDGFVLNVSSPNTKGLRDLQDPKALGSLVGKVCAATDRPVLVKLSPDIEIEQARVIADAGVTAGASGMVLTNTTTDYSTLPEAHRVGGLSGGVLRERSLELLRALAGDLFGHCVLVSVGGVSSGRDAYTRIRAGASLVQLYTALVFEGPALAKRIAEELAKLLARDGFESISDAAGVDLGRTAESGRTE